MYTLWGISCTPTQTLSAGIKYNWPSGVTRYDVRSFLLVGNFFFFYFTFPFPNEGHFLCVFVFVYNRWYLFSAPSNPHLLQKARLKIQEHMWYGRGVSHGAIAKSQTGCKTRSVSSPSLSLYPCCLREPAFFSPSACRDLLEPHCCWLPVKQA